MSTESKWSPLYDRVLVKRIPEEEKTAGGLFIPTAAKEKPMRATVISVGQGKVTDAGQKLALVVKPGDLVLFGKYSGSEIKIDGEDLIVLREEEILMVCPVTTEKAE